MKLVDCGQLWVSARVRHGRREDVAQDGPPINRCVLSNVILAFDDETWGEYVRACAEELGRCSS